MDFGFLIGLGLIIAVLIEFGVRIRFRDLLLTAKRVSRWLLILVEAHVDNVGSNAVLVPTA